MKKILIIDNERFMRRTIVSALRQEGFETLETENGADGIEVARSRKPDLILCDVMMEKLDGYATLAALRDDPATATIPFVLMTAAAERNGMRQGMLLGADDYLPKPFSVEDLIATVNARLAKQQAWQRQANSKLAGFCSNISSNLPVALLNPLCGIMESSESLLHDGASLSVEDTVEMAGAINISARELHRVIESYLLFAQVELFSADERKVASLRGQRTVVTRKLIAEIAGAVARHSCRLDEVTVEGVEARLMISPDYFRRIVTELLGNALRYSPSGSPIRLSSGVDTEGFRLTVVDAGTGMTPEQIASAGPEVTFDQHLGLATSPGVGLILVRRLVELHGGRLRIQSEIGHGTTVEVRLPAVGTVRD